MAKDKAASELETQREIWKQRLWQSGASDEEVDRCMAWLEEVVLNGILIGWFIQGQVSMRWNALENRPDFDAL